jgi:hypothetical protein
MLHINFERQLDSDFTGLTANLITLFADSLLIDKEIFLVAFDDGTIMKANGATSAVSPEDVEKEYVASKLSTVYGIDDSSYGKINYSRVLYVAHPHPHVVQDGTFTRPSGKDTNGKDADYENTKDFVKRPHYVIDGKYIYCIDYSRNEQIVSGKDGQSQLVSFAGRWQWGSDFLSAKPLADVMYLSDEHFSADGIPQTGTGSLKVEDNYDLKEFEKIKSEMIIDESSNIIFQTNE